MRALRRFLKRLSGSATGRRDDERLRDELEAHLAMQTDANIRSGLSPEEARRQALLKFGSLEATKESYREGQRLPVLDDVGQDMRYGCRLLRKSPLFTLTATASLAMGIGANTATFTVIERVLLHPLPVTRPHELVYVADERSLTQSSPRFSYPFYTMLSANEVLDGVAAHAGVSLNAIVNGRFVRAGGELVSGSYFGVLGASAQMGRLLSPEDDRTPGAHAVAVLSDRFWRGTLNSDPSVIGQSILLNGHPFSIVGVAGKGFAGTDLGLSADMWIPLSMQRELGKPLLTEARTNWLEVFGRLNSGLNPELAARELSTHIERRSAEVPSPSARRLILVRADTGNSAARRELGPALIVLMALTALALALACVNVAGLAAVRAASREKEIAVRLALGARRSRLTRQLLTEALVLAALGGTAGLLIAPWTARVIVASQSRTLHIDTSVDLRALMFGLAASLLTGVMVALTPMLASGKIRLAHVCESSWRPGTASRRLTALDLIVALQMGMALAMLISAALFVQSLRGFNSVDPGFRAEHLLLASLDPAGAGYDSNRIDGFWRTTVQQLRQVPGVEIVSLAGTVPLAATRQRQPWRNPDSGENLEIDTNFVGPAYFQALGTPLLRGREFGDEDRRTSRPVVIVNERLAAMFWPEQDPIGKSVRLPDLGNPPAEVVGVVRDVKYRDLRGETGPMFYRPLLQTRSTDPMTLHIRASGDPGVLMTAVRVVLQNIDRNVPLFHVTTLEDQLDSSFAQTRQAALLSGLFGVLALLLSGVGVYGVMSLAVSRRTRDIGIRMALGARPVDIVRTIGRRGVMLVVAGLGLGLLGSLAFAQVTETLLFGITPADTATFAGMAGVLGLVALVALWIPVRAATRLDVVAAIRGE
jgi:macrolide transport system ATP-binding/permease protein